MTQTRPTPIKEYCVDGSTVLLSSEVAVYVGSSTLIVKSPFQKYVPSEQRKSDQKLVDEAVIKAIGKRADKKVLRGYLKSAFGLRSSQYPHRMAF